MGLITLKRKLIEYPFLKGMVSCLSHPVKKFTNVRKIKRLSKDCNVISEFDTVDYSPWNRAFLKLMILSNEERFVEMIVEFYNESLELIKNHDFKSEDVVVVCLLKNEIYRVREFVRHYRELGADGFVFLDNGSDDGTVEFLSDQPDVALFKINKKYNSVRKTAWINKAISYFGLNRWYIIPDSDEFFVYPEMDKMHLKDYLGALSKKGIGSVKTMMLEMYPNAPFFDESRDPGDFRKTYCYYDRDGLFQRRVFGSNEKTYRPKPTALYYNGNRYAIGSHDFYPQKENVDADFGGIVLHYKFLSNEREKINNIVQSGIYANNSYLYKLYKKRFDEDKDFNAFYEGSLKWNGIESFNTFGFIRRLSER